MENSTEPRKYLGIDPNNLNFAYSSIESYNARTPDYILDPRGNIYVPLDKYEVSKRNWAAIRLNEKGDIVEGIV